jgi:hypothetical protein
LANTAATCECHQGLRAARECELRTLGQRFQEPHCFTAAAFSLGRLNNPEQHWHQTSQVLGLPRGVCDLLPQRRRRPANGSPELAGHVVHGSERSGSELRIACTPEHTGRPALAARVGPYQTGLTNARFAVHEHPAAFAPERVIEIILESLQAGFALEEMRW